MRYLIAVVSWTLLALLAIAASRPARHDPAPVRGAAAHYELVQSKPGVPGVWRRRSDPLSPSRHRVNSFRPSADVRAGPSRRRIAGHRRRAGPVRGRGRGHVPPHRHARRAGPLRRRRSTRPAPDVVGRTREAELRAAAAELGLREVCVLGYPDGALDGVNDGRGDRAHRRPPPPRQAAGGGHVRARRRLRPHRSHRHQPVHDRRGRGRGAIRRGAADGEPAEPHRVSKLYFIAWSAGEVGGLSGGAEASRRPSWTARSARPRRGRTGRSRRSWTRAACGRRCGARCRATRPRWPSTTGSRTLPDEHQRALWGTQEFYRVFSSVNGGRAPRNRSVRGAAMTRRALPVADALTRRTTPLSMPPDEFRDARPSAGRSRGRPAGAPRRGPRVGATTRRPTSGRCSMRRAACPRAAATPAAWCWTARGCCSITRCSTGTRGSSATSPRARRRSACSATSWPPRSTRTSARGTCRRSPPRWSCQTVRWIAELIGLPAGGAGLLVSGGNMANFIGVPRGARGHGRVGRAQGGAWRAVRSSLYVSAETHTWVQKAADMFGLGTDAIRWIPTDARAADGRGGAAAAGRAGRARRAAGRSSRSARPARSAPARWIRWPTSPRCAASTACGSTWTAPTAPWPRRRRAPRRACAGWSRPTRSPSIRTSGSTRRSKRAASSCAIRRRCARRSPTTRPTTASTNRS